jgi:hypothetical protein
MRFVGTLEAIFRFGWLRRDAVNLEALDHRELAATFPNVV